MELVHISKILETLKVGCTAPCLAITDDGRHVVLKTFNNCEGNLILFNEWVSFCFAKKLSLPIPDAFWGMIDGNTSFDIEFDSNNYGICFCSTYISKSNVIMPTFVKTINNIEAISTIILFDHWIYNADRNEGNILIDFNNKRLFIIDHSHVFSDTQEWTKYDLTDIMSKEVSSDHTIMKSNYNSYSKIIEQYPRELFNVQELANEKLSLFDIQTIRDIIYSTPSELLIPKENCCVLEEFLRLRIEYKKEMCDAIMSFGRMGD